MIKLSVLLYVDTDVEETVKRCINSITVSSGLSADDIQLIILDPGKMGREFLKKETEYINVTGQIAPYAYNVGLERAKGEYLAFLPGSSFYGEGALNVLNTSKAGNLISFCPEYCEKNDIGEDYKKRITKGGALDAEKEPENLQLVAEAYLVKREFLGELRFRESLREEAHTELLLKLLQKNNGKIWYEQNASYYYSVPQQNMKLSDLPEERWWYEESVQSFLIPFMQEMQRIYSGKIPKYLQNAVYYLLCLKYKANLAGNDKLMLNNEEVAVFFALSGRLLTMIDNEVIYQQEELLKADLPGELRMVFLNEKARQLGSRLNFEKKDDIVYCQFVSQDAQIAAPIVVGNLKQDLMLNVRVINYRKGNLEIDGFFRGSSFLDFGEYSLYGKIEGDAERKIPVKRTEVYSLLKCFGVTYAKKYAAHIEIPVKELAEGKRKLSFYVEHEGTEYQLTFKFTSIHSRLLTNSQRAYWKFDHNRYTLHRHGNYFMVEKGSVWGNFKKELPLLAVLLKQKPHKEAFTCVGIRLWYWLTLPFYRKKRIWLTFDKLYKAGDNGEYFFRYCEKQEDGIDCYYVINKDAPDYERLAKEHKQHLLIYDTWKCRLMALRAEAVMATHAGTAAYLSFPVPYHKYFKDLYQADNICIQHGLSIQKIANFQNRLYANTRLYCLASPFERDNVGHAVYGYEPEMLKMTGLARYDGLKNNEKKQILITPTWRKNVVHTKGVGMTNEHSGHFKETTYFKIYNSLINDENLIACAKRLGYRVIFLLHPAMSAQMDDYDRNDHVELLQATGDMSYEQILTESSLMVTDYSGVQFDFAYQRKPILYYHPDELPPHYTEGGLIYSTMGFGPICTGHEQLVSELCEYMENGCKMKEKYKERADRFFAFDDFNSAQRIYQEVIKFESEK